MCEAEYYQRIFPLNTQPSFPFCRPTGLRFHRNGSGKPALTWPAALDHCDGAALHFNLSHTRGLMGETQYMLVWSLSIGQLQRSVAHTTGRLLCDAANLA